MCVVILALTTWCIFFCLSNVISWCLHGVWWSVKEKGPFVPSNPDYSTIRRQGCMLSFPILCRKPCSCYMCSVSFGGTAAEALFMSAVSHFLFYLTSVARCPDGISMPWVSFHLHLTPWLDIILPVARAKSVASSLARSLSAHLDHPQPRSSSPLGCSQNVASSPGLQSCHPGPSAGRFSHREATEASLLFTQGSLQFIFFFKLFCIHLCMFACSFPHGEDCKESACSPGDPGWIRGSWRSPAEGNGSPVQYSCLGSPMDRGAWVGCSPGVSRSQTWLSD